MQKVFIYVITLLFTFPAYGQFHTMKMPRPSPKVVETQQLGVTDITVEYHSPAVRGRDVWTQVVPFEGEPIPWRAGANMNTRIRFSTDVQINGVDFPAGSYGFHVIPHRQGPWTLLFAENDNQWGSYYLDVDNDVFQKIEVTTDSCTFQENLNYAFINRTDSTVDVAVQWAHLSIPFTVSVNLDETVVERFRYELSGINTYRWEAWNDAAQWCLQRRTNLEEALAWANRSINGGYGGFAANKNINNLTTKVQLLLALGRTAEAKPVIAEATNLMTQPYEAYNLGNVLMRDLADFKTAKEFYQKANEQFPGTWYLVVGGGLTEYFLGNKKEAVSILENAKTQTPERMHARLDEIVKEMNAGTFELR